MGTNVWFGIGVIATVVIMSAVLFLIIMKAGSANGKIKRDYDERQELIRGRGFKYGFYTIVSLNVVYGVTDVAFKGLPVVSSVAMFIVVLCGICVYAWYCIFKDGYFALNENSKNVITTFLIIAFVNLFIGISNIIDDRLFEDGKLTYNCLNLVCSIFMFATVIVIFVKRHMDKKAE